MTLRFLNYELKTPARPSYGSVTVPSSTVLRTRAFRSSPPPPSKRPVHSSCQRGAEAGRSPPAPQICPLPNPAVPPPQLLPGAATPQLLPHFSPGRCPQICNVTPRTCQRPQKRRHDKETRIKAGLQFPRVVFLPSPRSSPEQAFMGSLRIVLRSSCVAQNVTLLTMISPAVAMEIAILPCTRVFFFFFFKTTEIFWQAVCLEVSG